MTWIDDKQEAGRQLWASSPAQLLPESRWLTGAVPTGYFTSAKQLELLTVGANVKRYVLFLSLPKPIQHTLMHTWSSNNNWRTFYPGSIDIPNGNVSFERSHALSAFNSDKILLRRRSVWDVGGMILTGENWSTGRETLYSAGGRWMNGYGALVEWYWQGKTEVLGEKHYIVWVVGEWMGMEQWWNDTDRGKLKYWERNII